MFKCKVRVSSHCCAHCLESEAIRASLGSEQNWKVPQTLWCSLKKVRGEYSSLLISSSDLHSFTEKGWLVLTPGPWLWPNIEESSIAYLGPDPWLLPAHMPSHHLGCLLPDLHDNRHLCEWLTRWTSEQTVQLWFGEWDEELPLICSVFPFYTDFEWGQRIKLHWPCVWTLT